MSPNPDTLCAGALMLSSAVCSGHAGRNCVVSERRSESEWDPMPRAPAISVGTRSIPTVSNLRGRTGGIDGTNAKKTPQNAEIAQIVSKGLGRRQHSENQFEGSVALDVIFYTCQASVKAKELTRQL